MEWGLKFGKGQRDPIHDLAPLIPNLSPAFDKLAPFAVDIFVFGHMASTGVLVWPVFILGLREPEIKLGHYPAISLSMDSIGGR